MSDEAPASTHGLIRSYVGLVAAGLVGAGLAILLEKDVDRTRQSLGVVVAIAGLPIAALSLFWKPLTGRLNPNVLTRLLLIATDTRWCLLGLLLLSIPLGYLIAAGNADRLWRWGEVTFGLVSAFGGSLLGAWGVKRRAEPPQAQLLRLNPLTPDQQHFRVALKQFAMTYPARLSNMTGTVRGILIHKIKEMGDQDFAYPLHHAIHFAWSASPIIKRTEYIRELADTDMEMINITNLQHEITLFFDEYEWDQRAIANLNVLAKVDLEGLDITKKWIAADAAAFSELEKLKTWSEASDIKNISDSKMAQTKTNWTIPVRINF